MKKNYYNFIDLFSGCGGFSCGLELAGHRCLLGVDIDKDAINTFIENHPHASYFNHPIENLDQKTFKKIIREQKIDLIVGGPPCQGFSTVGRGLVKDKRNKLFIHFVKIVSWVKPKVIILENVTGLLAQKNSSVLKNIFKQFESLGYSMSARILKAEEFGAPTQRRRTFIVGCMGADPETIFPTKTDNIINIETAWKLWLKNSAGEISNHDLTKAEISNKLDFKRIEKIPEGQAIRYQEDEEKFLPEKLKLGINWLKLPENRLRQKKYHRLDRKKMAPTIMTSSRTYFHPTQSRYLTIREVAALQSFPADFIFKGSYTSMYRQIGNAVPPAVAKAFGEAISQVEFTNKNNKKIKNKKVDLYKLRSSAFRYQQELS